MKRILVKALLFLFLSSYSLACSILQVPIGSTVDTAKDTFDFLDIHNSEAYGKDVSVLYRNYAIDYCEGSPLENVDLEVIVHDSRIASINLFSDSEFKNEFMILPKILLVIQAKMLKMKIGQALKILVLVV